MTALLHLDRDEPALALQRIEAAEALAAEQRVGLVLEPDSCAAPCCVTEGIRRSSRLFAPKGLPPGPGPGCAPTAWRGWPKPWRSEARPAPLWPL